PVTGGCTDVVWEADVKKTLPNSELCNQAYVSRNLGPVFDICDARGGSLGCTSPPNDVGSENQTCIFANVTAEIHATKKVIGTSGGSDPDVFEAGDTVTYELCLDNQGNSVLVLVEVKDFLPLDQFNQPLFYAAAPDDCASNFTQTPDVGATTYENCADAPPHILIAASTVDDFWLYPQDDPDGVSSVCFTYDVVSQTGLPHQTLFCNRAEITWQGRVNPVLIPEVCEQIVDGPYFGGSTKAVDDQNPIQGSSITYTINAYNIGTQAANGIVIEDQLDAGCLDLTGFDPATDLTFSPVPNSWTAYMVGNLLHIEIDDQIASKTGVDITFTLPLPAGATGRCCNTAEISSPPGPNPELLLTNTIDPNPLETDETLTCFDIGGAAALQASKTVNPTGDVMQGETLSYTVTIQNTGSQNATNVDIFDTLDDCLDCSTFVDDPAPPVLTADCVSRTIGLTGQTIPGNGGSLTLAYSIDVDQSARLWPPCCNEARISYWRTPGDPASQEVIDSDRVCTNVLPIPIPDFTFYKDVDDLSYPRIASQGTGIVYVFTVVNTGTMNASITIEDTFETCLDISNFDPTTSVTVFPGTADDVRLNGRDLEIDLTLPYGGEAQYIYLNDISIDAAAPPGDCINQASFDFGGQTWLSDDPADPTGIEPTIINIVRLDFTKDVGNISFPRSAMRGDPVVYVLTIDNLDGLDGAISIRDRFADCLDYSGFDPALSVTAVPGPLTDVRLGGFGGNRLTIELDLESSVPQQVITLTDLAIDMSAPIGDTCDNQASLTFGSSSWDSNDPGEDPPYDDPTDIMVVDQPVERLRRQGTQDPCPLAGRPSDMATIFAPSPTTVTGGPLPWEFQNDLPAPPVSESCLIFYQSDEVACIAVIRGTSDPQNHVTLDLCP
ncbi:hypothetical protein ACFLU6_14665, partial [Acidobacteriota bacterium]